MNTNLISFSQLLSNLFQVLGVEENKEELLGSLTESLLLTFSRLIASDEKIIPLLVEYSQTPNSDPSKLLAFLDSKNVEYLVHFKSAQDQTLQSFISKLSATLPADKIDAAKRLVSGV